MKTRRFELVLLCCAVLAFFVLGIASYAASETVFNNENGYGVQNNAPGGPQFTLSEPKILTYIRTYHWNNGAGAPAGTISLVKDGRTVYSAQATIGSRYYWVVQPNLVFPAGTYTISDSSPATWSWNGQSGNRGFGLVNADPVPIDSKGAVASYYGTASDQKGPVQLSAVPPPPKPYLVIDKTTIKVGDIATVKVMNVPQGSAYQYMCHLPQPYNSRYWEMRLDPNYGNTNMYCSYKGEVPGTGSFTVTRTSLSGAETIGTLTLTVEK